MSVAELPTRTTQAPADAHHVADQRRFTITLEHAIYMVLCIIALLAHLWALGDRALHHDETHHSYFPWQLFMGQGYVHDPLLHGPFLYHLSAFVFFLFSDNNFTARLGPALFGSLLVVTPFLIRREIGRGAALIAATYLVISPAFLYTGRFIRHDMYGVTFEILAFIGIVRYASTHRARWLYLTAAALALMFTNMETFFLYVAIFGALLVVLFLWRTWRPGLLPAATLGVAIIALVFVLPGDAQRTGGSVQRAQGPYSCPSPMNPSPPPNPMLYEPGPIFGLPPLATADNDYALCVRHQPDNNLGLYLIKLGQFFEHPAIVSAVVFSLLGLTGLWWAIARRRGNHGLTAWQHAQQRGDQVVAAFASLGRGRRLVGALALFFVIYALFFSAFLTNPVGIISGTTGSFLYWLAQHEVQRGGQPWYYYLVLLFVYEPLLLLWGSIGLVLIGANVAAATVRRLRARRMGMPAAASTAIDWRRAMPLLLAWWSIATFAIYSWAGEKMPWLTIHIALPLTLLSAWALARVLHWAFIGATSVISPGTSTTGWGHEADLTNDGAPARAEVVANPSPVLDRTVPVYVGLFSVIVAFGFVLLTILIGSDGAQQDATPWVPLLLGVLLALLTIFYAILRGLRTAIGALALAVVLVGSLYTIRSAFQINYRWGDVPREMLIYTQTSPDVARVMERLEKASIKRGGALDMPIWYDNETIWRWYLRRFTNAQQQQPALSTPPGPEVQAVLMLQENLDTYPQNREVLEGFRIQRYPLRWWFPETTYRLPPDWRTAPLNDDSPLLMRVLRAPFDGRTATQFWQYMLYRQPPTRLGSTDFVIAVRPQLADEIGLGTGGSLTPEG